MRNPAREKRPLLWPGVGQFLLKSRCSFKAAKNGSSVICILTLVVLCKSGGGSALFFVIGLVLFRTGSAMMCRE